MSIDNPTYLEIVYEIVYMDNPTWRLSIDNPTYLEIVYKIVYMDNPTYKLSIDNPTWRMCIWITLPRNWV